MFFRPTSKPFDSSYYCLWAGGYLASFLQFYSQAFARESKAAPFPFGKLLY